MSGCSTTWWSWVTRLSPGLTPRTLQPRMLRFSSLRGPESRRAEDRTAIKFVGARVERGRESAQVTSSSADCATRLGAIDFRGYPHHIIFFWRPTRSAQGDTPVEIPTVLEN